MSEEKYIKLLKEYDQLKLDHEKLLIHSEHQEELIAKLSFELRNVKDRYGRLKEKEEKRYW